MIIDPKNANMQTLLFPILCKSFDLNMRHICEPNSINNIMPIKLLYVFMWSKGLTTYNRNKDKC